MNKQAPLRLLAVSCGTKDTIKQHVHPRNVDDTRLVLETRLGKKRVRIAKYQQKKAIKHRQLILKLEAKSNSRLRLETSMAATVVRNKYKKAIKKAEKVNN